MFRSLLAAALLASFAMLQVVASLPTVSVKGSKFFAGGEQFFLKGVAYQGTPADPLINTNQCQLDAKSMQEIGTNSIRVYHVDPYGDHDGCMAAFSDAGIYVWLDLDTFNTTVVQTDPQWTQEQFFAFALVMDVFQGYDNLGGFWIGNEVINTATGSPAAPYVKAATADMKSYMATKKYRSIPIGYSAADIAELRPMLQNYLACGDSLAQSIDFFGLNSYEWCGSATYQTSGYDNLQAMSEGYSIPIFFSETGCNVGGERTFQDQTAIFGSEMVGTWSGSIIYEWVEETNHYGLVSYPNGEIYSGAPTPIQPDFNNLMNVWKTIKPSGVAEGSYTPSFGAPACPMASAGWGVNGNVPLPTLGASIISAAAANQKPSPVPTTSSTASSTTSSTFAKVSPTSTNKDATITTATEILSRVVSDGGSLTSILVSTTLSPTANNNAVSTTAPAPSPSTTHSGAMSVRVPPYIGAGLFKTLAQAYKDITGFFDGMLRRYKGQELFIVTTIIVLLVFLAGVITVVAFSITLCCQEHSGDPRFYGTVGWGFRPELCDGGIAYGGYRELDDIDIVFQCAKERRERREVGLPAGAAWYGEGIRLRSLGAGDGKGKGKERARADEVFDWRDEDSEMLRLE
ncbi:hypothetical protein EG329_012824 [Mollisiaceae sp. DMI_Dod_QoI]|nr:hypothetical protein EG329_012824 [Helotiales sp. DMI_Dod_QoI]